MAVTAAVRGGETHQDWGVDHSAHHWIAYASLEPCAPLQLTPGVSCLVHHLSPQPRKPTEISLTHATSTVYPRTPAIAPQPAGIIQHPRPRVLACAHCSGKPSQQHTVCGFLQLSR